MVVINLGNVAFNSYARLESVREIEMARKARRYREEETKETSRQVQEEEEVEEGEIIERDDQELREEVEIVEIEKEINKENGIMIVNSDVLDCSICYNPLRPPLFQCAFGHAFCSTCTKSLFNRCHVCSRTTGRFHCHTLEMILETTMVFCPNKNLGCNVQIPYYQKPDHKISCPYSLCVCPEESCQFASSASRVLDHGRTEHKWPVDYFQYGVKFTVSLSASCHFKVLVDKYDRMFLLKVIRKPQGKAFSVVFVQLPRLCEPKFWCELGFNLSQFKASIMSSTLERETDNDEVALLGISHKSLLPDSENLKVGLCIYSEI